MFKKIILVYKKNLDKNLFVHIEKIKQYFPSSMFVVVDYDSVNKEILNETDLVITLGGDGTFVKAANLVENSLIFGVNSHPISSEGLLTSITINEIDKFEKIAKGDFQVLERQRAEITLNGKIIQEKAINEVYVGAASQFHSSRYKLIFKDKTEEQRSSGVIISTGNGSTGWFKSAGGEPFGFEEKKLKFIIREPYFGKRVFVPKLLSGEILHGEKLKIESTRDFGSIIAINDSVYDFNKGAIVEIQLSDKPLRVIKI